MKPNKAKSSFQKHLKAVGLELNKMTPFQGIDAMLSFYRNESADGCSDDNADMLLFQWGAYDWGDGEFFELNITRQLIFGGFEDENIWQLSLTFKYNPNDEHRQLESGNKWCGNTGGIDQFNQFIQESRALKLVVGEKPLKIVLEFECAG